MRPTGKNCMTGYSPPDEDGRMTPRILFLYGDIPWPANTGARIRTYNLLVNSARSAKITLLTLLNPANAAADRERIAQMERAGVRVIAVPRLPETKREFAQTIASSFFSPRPVIVDRYSYGPYVAKARELAASGQFDLLHCDSISLAEAVLPQNSRTLPVGFTAHNVEAIIWERWAQEEPNMVKRWYVRAQHRKVLRYEEMIAQRSELVCAVSEEDQRRLTDLYRAKNAQVVPNGVDTEYFAPQPVTENADTLVFTGSMDWRPNQDGILWFIDEIWPRLLQARPKLTFHIVGRRPPERVVRLGQTDPRLVVTGTVDDVRGYIARAAVYVVPLRIGGGSRLKILEALAMRKGIVSTTVGAEGLRLTDGEHLVLADTPEQFAARVSELLDTPKRRQSLGTAGEALVKQQYAWPRIADEQVRLWTETITRHQQMSPAR